MTGMWHKATAVKWKPGMRMNAIEPKVVLGHLQTSRLVEAAREGRVGVFAFPAANESASTLKELELPCENIVAMAKGDE